MFVRSRFPFSSPEAGQAPGKGGASKFQPYIEPFWILQTHRLEICSKAKYIWFPQREIIRKEEQQIQAHQIPPLLAYGANPANPKDNFPIRSKTSFILSLPFSHRGFSSAPALGCKQHKPSLQSWGKKLVWVGACHFLFSCDIAWLSALWASGQSPPLSATNL